MNAPLSRYLTRFAEHEAPSPVLFDIIASEPTVTLSVAELQSRIDAGREAALREAQARHDAELAEQVSRQERAIEAALAESRSLWLAAEGATHAEALTRHFTDLESSLSARVAVALRPLLDTALVERTCEAVSAAITHILSDPEHPAVTVRGPADLIDVIRDARAAAGKTERVVYLATDMFEITVDAAGSHLETRLAASLAALKGL